MDEARLSEDSDELGKAVPPHLLLYRIGPDAAREAGDWRAEVTSALRNPIGSPPLSDLVGPCGTAVILADDLTRATPQKEILPPLLASLNAAGVPDWNVTVIVALGTHRYMTEHEIRARVGEEVYCRVRVVNHLWQDPVTFVDLGCTARGTPVKVNAAACEADLLIGTGSIVPHVYAGWAGGAKIVQPGICSAETTARTHCMAADTGDLLGVAGHVENPVRHEIEEVARLAGLKFILNVVSDAGGAPAWVGAGDPVQTHRAGVATAKEIYVREIPGPADIVLVDAQPATKDYWQGIKALAHAQRGLKRGGVAILVGGFPEGIAPTHPEMARHARESYGNIERAWGAGRLTDGIAFTTLRLHALIMERCEVICVSEGMSAQDKNALGFRHTDSVEDALEVALTATGGDAGIGIIDHAGDVLPQVTDL